MNDLRVDLHSHTTHSDGTLSVAKLIDKALSVGIDVLSITDHDNMNGVLEAQNYIAKNQLKIKLVSGIEISCFDPFIEKNIHLLGYFLDPTHPELKSFLETLQQNRLERNLSLLQKLFDKGMDLITDPAFNQDQLKYITRLNIALKLVERGYFDSISKVFQKSLSNRHIKDIKSPTILLPDVLSLIKSCNGMSILAHPCLIKLKNKKLGKMLLHNQSLGLDGVEIFHPTTPYATQEWLVQFCTQKDLQYSHGSDFHGDQKPSCILGKSYCVLPTIKSPFISSTLQAKINML